MKKHTLLGRILFYVLGMMLLAIGLTLTAETHLGASPLTALPFVVSLRVPIPFADTTLLLFTLYVVTQLLLRRDQKMILPILLQLPLSLLFTRVMGVAQSIIDIAPFSVGVRLCFLVLAIILTGVGAAMSLKMKLVPNPGDGFVQALAEKSGKPLGMAKNMVDIVSVLLAAVVSLLLFGHLEGVGIGSVVAMLGVGRVIAFYNKLTAQWTV